MYYVYMIRCSGGALYTGITTDVQRRIAEHSGSGGKGAKFTRSRRPESLEALWSTDSRSSASKLEYAVKQLTREKKLLLISGELSPDQLFDGQEAPLFKREALPDISL